MTISEMLFTVVVAGGLIGFTWYWATNAIFKYRFSSFSAKVFAIIYTLLVLFCISKLY